RRSSGWALSHRGQDDRTNDTPSSVDLFAEPPFRADAEAVADDQHADQQFWIDRRPSCLAVKGGQVCPKLIELNEGVDRAQQMCLRHMPFKRKLVEQRVLLDLPLPHYRLPPAVVT